MDQRRGFLIKQNEKVQSNNHGKKRVHTNRESTDRKTSRDDCAPGLISKENKTVAKEF